MKSELERKMVFSLHTRDLERAAHEQRKAERRSRFEQRTGSVHLRGGRRAGVRHGKRHNGRPVERADAAQRQIRQELFAS